MDIVKKDAEIGETPVHHTVHHSIHHSKKFTSNPWMIATVVLAVLVLVLGVMYFFQSASKSTVEKNVLAFAKEKGVDATLKSISMKDGFYEVILTINGQDAPLYVTKDGKYLVPQYLPLASDGSDIETTEPPAEVPKTAKPTVELYVFTYCPYGLQMEKAFAPVIDLLGSKIDYKIRQIGAMHGDYEKVEAQRQLCIEKEFLAKFLTYVKAFAEDTAIGTCGSDVTCSKPKVDALMTKLGITSSKIDACMKTDGEALYNAEVTNSGAKGVGGSPTIIINGVESQLSRSPEDVKKAICNAFTTTPSECSQTLSTTQASPGFGAGAGSASSSSASC